MSFVPLENIVAEAAITQGMRTSTRFTIRGSRDRGVESHTFFAWRLTMSRIAWTEVSWKPSVGKRLVKSWSYFASKRHVFPSPSTSCASRVVNHPGKIEHRIMCRLQRRGVFRI